MPLRGQDLPFAVATWGAVARKGWALQLLSCPFGSVGKYPASKRAAARPLAFVCAAPGSVFNWERVGRALRLVLAVLFLLPYCRYVDDLFGAVVFFLGTEASAAVHPSEEAWYARAVLEGLLGWELDAAKRETVRIDRPRSGSRHAGAPVGAVRRHWQPQYSACRSASTCVRRLYNSGLATRSPGNGLLQSGCSCSVAACPQRRRASLQGSSAGRHPQSSAEACVPRTRTRG